MHDDFQKQIESKSDEELRDIYMNSDQFQSEFIELVMKELEHRKIDLSATK